MGWSGGIGRTKQNQTCLRRKQLIAVLIVTIEAHTPRIGLVERCEICQNRGFRALQKFAANQANNLCNGCVHLEIHWTQKSGRDPPLYRSNKSVATEV